MEDAWPHLLASLVAHVAPLLVCATLLPALGDDSQTVERDAAAYEVLPPVRFAFAPNELVPIPAWPDPADEQGAPPQQDDSDLMGKLDADAKDAHYAIAGPGDNPDPHLSRFDHTGPVEREGVHGSSFSGATQRAMTAPWGRDDALGTDPITELGAMWGAKAGAARGREGLSGAEPGESVPRPLGSSHFVEVGGERGYRCRLP